MRSSSPRRSTHSRHPPTSNRLQELAQLHTQGVLSDEEFSAAKAKVLGI